MTGTKVITPRDPIFADQMAPRNSLKPQDIRFNEFQTLCLLLVAGARERSAGQDGVAGSAFPGRGLAAVDFVQMERTVSAAFAARGLQHLFSFVKRD